MFIYCMNDSDLMYKKKNLINTFLTCYFRIIYMIDKILFTCLKIKTHLIYKRI